MNGLRFFRAGEYLYFLKLVKQRFIMCFIFPHFFKPWLQSAYPLIIFDQDLAPLSVHVAAVDLGRVQNCIVGVFELFVLAYDFVGDCINVEQNHLFTQCLECRFWNALNKVFFIQIHQGAVSLSNNFATSVQLLNNLFVAKHHPRVNPLQLIRESLSFLVHIPRCFADRVFVESVYFDASFHDQTAMTHDVECICFVLNVIDSVACKVLDFTESLVDVDEFVLGPTLKIRQLI